MSVPPPWIVQVPPVTDWLPTGVGLPMSAQLQPLAQLAAGDGGEIPTLSESTVTELARLELCEVTARPWSSVPVRLRVIAEPGMAVQVRPSLEVYAPKLLPTRATSR